MSGVDSMDGEDGLIEYLRARGLDKPDFNSKWHGV